MENLYKTTTDSVNEFQGIPLSVLMYSIPSKPKFSKVQEL